MNVSVREPRRSDRVWAEEYLAKATMAWAPKGTDPRVTGVLLRMPEPISPKVYRAMLESRVSAMWILSPVAAAMEIKRRLPWEQAAMVLEAPLLDVGERLVTDLGDHLTGLADVWMPGAEEPGTEHLATVKAVGFREWVALVLPETD
jgi:hypothetical protein